MGEESLGAGGAQPPSLPAAPEVQSPTAFRPAVQFAPLYPAGSFPGVPPAWDTPGKTVFVVYGEARITEGGAAALLQRLAHTYLGPGVTFPPEPFRTRPGYITCPIAWRASDRGTRGKPEPWSA